MKTKNYLTPSLERIDYKLEKGFATSNHNAIDPLTGVIEDPWE